MCSISVNPGTFTHLYKDLNHKISQKVIPIEPNLVFLKYRRGINLIFIGVISPNMC